MKEGHSSVRLDGEQCRKSILLEQNDPFKTPYTLQDNLEEVNHRKMKRTLRMLDFNIERSKGHTHYSLEYRYT